MYVNGWKISKILTILNFQKGQGSKNNAKKNLRATQVIYLHMLQYTVCYTKNSKNVHASYLGYIQSYIRTFQPFLRSSIFNSYLVEK